MRGLRHEAFKPNLLHGRHKADNGCIVIGLLIVLYWCLENASAVRGDSFRGMECCIRRLVPSQRRSDIYDADPVRL